MIYNGGLRDWEKSGYKIDVIEPLPEYGGKFITADELLAMIKEADSYNCLDQNKKPLLTLVDYRTENFLKTDRPLHSIKTKCKTIKCLLDDLTDPEVRKQIPKESPVVLVCETGNRELLIMKYLYKYGYTNTVGLRFGMRGWIKSGYPVETEK